jgi:hypothetical protein
MILNVSGRTDIVAFYSDWFINRYKEGYVDVRNPFYPKLVSRINFSNVEAIVFCTKNPLPILDKIQLIDKPIIFHITITPYNKDIEPNVINKKLVIEGVKKLATIIGKDNIYIRYDPVFLSDKYNIEYHIKAFSKLCTLLEGYTNHIIISFVDEYKNVKNNLKILKIIPFTEEDYKNIGLNFSRIAKEHNMTVQTCSEEKRLLEYGFLKKDCVDAELIYKRTGRVNYKKWKARNNKNCSCIEMVDIGAYNTCKHFCKYCYANYDEKEVIKNFSKHIKTSSLLIGELSSDDIIKERI